MHVYVSCMAGTQMNLCWTSEDKNTLKAEIQEGRSASTLKSRFAKNQKMVALVPGLPRFDLPLAFTTIHKIGRSTKIKMGKAWEHLSRERRHVDVGVRGPTAKAMHRTIRSSALPRFWAPDLSVIETTRLD